MLESRRFVLGFERFLSISFDLPADLDLKKSPLRLTRKSE